MISKLFPDEEILALNTDEDDEINIGKSKKNLKNIFKKYLKLNYAENDDFSSTTDSLFLIKYDDDDNFIFSEIPAITEDSKNLLEGYVLKDGEAKMFF